GSPGTRGKMAPVRAFALMLLCAGCLDDPVSRAPDLGTMCVGGVEGLAITNTGFDGMHRVTLNTSPGSGVWESDPFTIGAPFTFSRLQWRPLAPYLRELPATQDPPFDQDRIAMMSNNLFLAHLDETSGDDYLDVTGQQH